MRRELSRPLVSSFASRRLLGLFAAMPAWTREDAKVPVRREIRELGAQARSAVRRYQTAPRWLDRPAWLARGPESVWET